ncbi:hypothetical protein MQE23_38440 [Streptomyces sp. HP-A2021]|uniref:hypothetical protein n=1 Tax=Streptomyces sp. HP-A2021 TaxID=2927875 RepID=UPI001FAFE91C|nr:hypothetical protein [Streptomyces sp. HP-A2021]UOB14584.1 hypothetical protein MQE23_38440 [Streptomyces sp. HP-A2021]
MSESTGDDRQEPDFLDRLLARHAAPTARRPGVVRVRPRLAGPFERIEAVRGEAPDPDGTEPLWPVAAPAAVARPDLARPAAREVVRTERERTVVRTEQATAPSETGTRPARPAEREGPLLRPVTPTGPALRPVPDTARRAAGRGRTERAAATNAVSVPTPPGADAAPSPPCPPRCSPARRTRRQHGMPSGRRRRGGPGARPSRSCRCRSGGWRSPPAVRPRAVAAGPGHGTRSARGPRSAWRTTWPGGASEDDETGRRDEQDQQGQRDRGQDQRDRRDEQD